jgi:hypothetical protein
VRGIPCAALPQRLLQVSGFDGRGGCVDRESVQNGQFPQSDALTGVLKAPMSIASCAARSQAELRVQLPTKIEMAVNIKTAKALGLAVPPSILLRATEVIE